jgi:hypothetical protein
MQMGERKICPTDPARVSQPALALRHVTSSNLTARCRDLTSGLTPKSRRKPLWDNEPDGLTAPTLWKGRCPAVRCWAFGTPRVVTSRNGSVTPPTSKKINLCNGCYGVTPFFTPRGGRGSAATLSTFSLSPFFVVHFVLPLYRVSLSGPLPSGRRSESVPTKSNQIEPKKFRLARVPSLPEKFSRSNCQGGASPPQPTASTCT